MRSVFFRKVQMGKLLSPRFSFQPISRLSPHSDRRRSSLCTFSITMVWDFKVPRVLSWTITIESSLLIRGTIVSSFARRTDITSRILVPKGRQRASWNDPVDWTWRTMEHWSWQILETSVCNYSVQCANKQHPTQVLHRKRRPKIRKIVYSLKRMKIVTVERVKTFFERNIFYFITASLFPRSSHFLSNKLYLHETFEKNLSSMKSFSHLCIEAAEDEDDRIFEHVFRSYHLLIVMTIRTWALTVFILMMKSAEL